MNANDRETQIRVYAEQMRQLIIKRNFASSEIRDLHAEVARVLGIPRADFIAAMRLHAIAQKDRQSTAKHIGEILTALGTTLPKLPPPVEAPPPFKAPMLTRSRSWSEERRMAQSERARAWHAARREARHAP